LGGHKKKLRPKSKPFRKNKRIETPVEGSFPLKESLRIASGLDRCVTLIDSTAYIVSGREMFLPGTKRLELH
jgi:hypothetical protein